MAMQAVWKSADGTRTAIKDMEDGYLYNLFNYLKRQQLTSILTDEEEDARKNRKKFTEYWVGQLQKEIDKRQAEFVENAKKKTLHEIFNL